MLTAISPSPASLYNNSPENNPNLPSRDLASSHTYFQTSESERSQKEIWRSLGVLWPAEVDRLCARPEKFLVDGFLPAEGIAIAAGDSGIGKSPLLYQLALSVASGAPFLNMPVKQGRVLLFDLENDLADSKTLRDALVSFLGLGRVPGDFLIATEPEADLEKLALDIRPRLIIVDSLRAFRPDVSEKNSLAGAWLKEMRQLVRKHSCAFLFVHHLRKPGEASFARFLTEETIPTSWLLEMEGARALVNQSDVRIALAPGEDLVALKLKWSRRLRGNSPLIQLERKFDAAGEPVGYEPLFGPELLSPERRLALEALPAWPSEWTFQQAKTALGRSDHPTDVFLKAAMQLRLIEKLRKGVYRKVKSVK